MICKFCKTDKINTDFKLEKRTKLGYDSVCRKCRNLNRRRLRKLNPEILRKERIYSQTERYKNYHKQYYFKNKNKFSKINKEKYKNNKEPYLKRSKMQRKNNPERCNTYVKNWKLKNKAYINEENKKRFKTDVRYKLRLLIGTAIRKYLQGKIKKSNSEKYIGCSFLELKRHLESQFDISMNWENHGTWHIDHIIPCRAFDFSKEEEIKKRFHYTNLRPLNGVLNMSKNDKMPNGQRARDIF